MMTSDEKKQYKNPKPTVDIVILMEANVDDEFEKDKLVLIKRKNPPYGWALPGGFVDEGESYEHAAVREAKEETSLDIYLTEQFHTYSDPKRDPRQHTASTVFIGLTEDEQEPKAADDATEIKVVTFEEALSMDLAFDHRRIVQDVLDYFVSGERPTPER
jgi:8-oxo-dGTP diphosphatase